MYTLYHCMSARSFRPLWTLEELRLPYVLKMLPFPPRVHAPEFRDINPLGTVPVFFDGTTRMTESSAICQYLAARAGDQSLNVAPNDPAFADFLNFLHFGEATLTFPQTLVLRYERFEPAERRQPQVAADYAKWFLSRLRGLESQLAAREFVCGERFTVADISVGYALMLCEHLDLHSRLTPTLLNYWMRLHSRSGFQRAMQAQTTAACEQGIPLAAAAGSLAG